VNRSQFRRQLLTWFDRHRRDLPWRHNRDPYRIWISEVMLQQTTVAAVVPYFHRFLKAFPTVRHLARADEQEVLHLWQGLGYYRRARHLHQAAKMIVNDWHGQFPDDPSRWQQLPGVGRYIMGAVLSQAFDRRLPIIEANSIRVLSRWFGQRGDPKSSAMQKWLWTTAEDVLPKKRIGDFNQAVMEIGALVCTPTAPKCVQCPIKSDCAANQQGRPLDFPTPAKPPAITHLQEVAVVVRHKGNVLIAQRLPNEKRWASMWEFPQTPVVGAITSELAAQNWLKRSLNSSVRLGPEITSIRYAVTRFRLTLLVLEATAPRARVKCVEYADARWVPPTDLKNYPMSTAQRKVAEIVAASARQRRLF